MGSGEVLLTIILVSGLGAQTSVFDDIAADLDPEFRLVHFDPNAEGAGDGDTWSADVAIDRLRAKVSETDGPVALVAHSLGGSLALAVSVDPPTNLVSLVVLDAGPRWERPEDRTASNREISLEGQRLFPSRGFERLMVESFVAEMTSNEGLRQELVVSFESLGPDLLREFLVQARQLQLRLQPRSLQLPTLVLVPCAPDDCAEYLADFRTRYAGAPQVEITSVENAEHFVMVDQPDRTVELIRRFLRNP